MHTPLVKETSFKVSAAQVNSYTKQPTSSDRQTPTRVDVSICVYNANSIRHMVKNGDIDVLIKHLNPKSYDNDKDKYRFNVKDSKKEGNDGSSEVVASSGDAIIASVDSECDRQGKDTESAFERYAQVAQNDNDFLLITEAKLPQGKMNSVFQSTHILSHRTSRLVTPLLPCHLPAR